MSRRFFARSVSPWVMGIALMGSACESKPDRKLEVQKLEVVESADKPGVLEVRVWAIEGTHVKLDPPFDVPGQGTIGYLSENPKNGLVVFEIPLAAMPAGTVEAELELTHYELRGQKVEMKVPLTRKPSIESQRGSPGFSSRLVCGGVECEVREGLGSGGFALEIKAPEGTKVEAGDAAGTVGTGTLVLRPNIAPRLLAIEMGKIDSSSSTETIGLPVKLVLPDGTTLAKDLAVGTYTLREEAFRALAAAASGPLALDGDTEAAKAKRDTMVYLKMVGSGPNLEGFYGPDATKVAEVDLVAIQTPTGQRERTCGTYVGPSGEKASFGVTMFDNEVAVYDRRSGKKLGSRAFPAPPGQCPSTISKSAGGASQTSEVEWTVMRDFAKKHME